MRRLVRFVLPLVAVAVLAGCGGDETATPAATTTTPAPAATTAAPAPVGTPDPMAVTSFACRPDAQGAWTARGTLKNTAKKDRDYRVVVLIGPDGGTARTVDLPNVRAGASVPFTLDAIVTSPDGPCQVQALVVP